MNPADLVAVPHWDGVHLWLDTFDPTKSAGRAVDLRISTAGCQVQEITGLALPAMVDPIAVYGLTLSWCPAGSGDPHRRAQVACVSPTYSAIFDADAVHTARRYVTPAEVDQILITRIGPHVQSWRITSITRPHPFRCLAVAESPGPRHIIRAPGEAIARIGGVNGREPCTLANAAVPDMPYQPLGPASDVTLTCIPREGSLKIAVWPARSAATPAS